METYTNMSRWWINRYILLRKGPGLEPLYHFEGTSGRTAIDQLYANDRARQRTNSNTVHTERLPMAETQEPPPTYSSRARMNF